MSTAKTKHPDPASMHDHDLTTSEGRSDYNRDYYLKRKAVAKAEGEMNTLKKGWASIEEMHTLKQGWASQTALSPTDVLQKVVTASTAGDWREVLKWEGCLDRLLYGQTEAISAFLVGAFGRAREQAKVGTVLDATVGDTGGSGCTDPASMAMLDTKKGRRDYNREYYLKRKAAGKAHEEGLMPSGAGQDPAKEHGAAHAALEVT